MLIEGGTKEDVVHREKDNPLLWNDVDKVLRWAEQWWVNPEKCAVMHFGIVNKPRLYTMNDRIRRSTEEQMALVYKLMDPRRQQHKQKR